MVTVVTMDASQGLGLLLQRRKRSLRLVDIAGLQRIANLAQRLGKSTTGAAAILRKGSISVLRSRKIARLNRADQLFENLPLRNGRRGYAGRVGNRGCRHDTSPAELIWSARNASPLQVHYVKRVFNSLMLKSVLSADLIFYASFIVGSWPVHGVYGLRGDRRRQGPGLD